MTRWCNEPGHQQPRYRHDYSRVFQFPNQVHGANMGPIWVLSVPDGPHVGPLNLAIREGDDAGSELSPLKPCSDPVLTCGYDVNWNGFNYINRLHCSFTQECITLVTPTHLSFTHLSRDKMVIMLQMIFYKSFSWKRNFVFWLKFYWILFLSFQLIIRQHWLR